MNQESELQKRLDALPRKTALPFRQLLAAGQLDEDTASLILEAGELAGNSSKLLGFAVGFLHMRAQGVPVHDVIRMAKRQQRRIHLGWSARRWKEEHDRLSRSEALDQLAREKVLYEVAAYEALLPARFDGYLIRTSRRLGMEGLRQRHCVAVYHDQLRAGSCAIASVFVDRQRWTVQMFISGQAEMPLRIGQIKTRLNGLPSDAVRDRIHQMLGVAPARHKDILPACQAGDLTYMDTLRRLLPLLRQHGVQRVEVEFDGCGDSGSIANISYLPQEPEFDDSITVEYVTVVGCWNGSRWSEERALTQGSVHNALETLTYDYLEETGVNWYDGDGGFGTLEIDVEAGTVQLHVDVRYTQCISEFSAERNIVSGEDL